MSIQTKGSDEVIWNVLCICKWGDVESRKQARVKEKGRYYIFGRRWFECSVDHWQLFWLLILVI